MAGPLSRESFAMTKQISRKFGYHPNRDDFDCLVATVEKAWDELDATKVELRNVYGHLAMSVAGRRILEELGDDDE